MGVMRLRNEKRVVVVESVRLLIRYRDLGLITLVRGKVRGREVVEQRLRRQRLRRRGLRVWKCVAREDERFARWEVKGGLHAIEAVGHNSGRSLGKRRGVRA